MILPAFMAAGSCLFSDLHKYEQDRPSSGRSPSSSLSSTGQKHVNKKHVHVAEAAEGDPAEQVEIADGQEDEEEDELTQQMMAEASQIADERQDLQQPEEIDKFAETMETLAVAADALPSLRSSRKGKGRSKGVPSAKAKAKGRGASASSSSSRSKDIQNKKAQSACRACGENGHWAGDPECSLYPGHDTLAIMHEADDMKSVQDVLAITSQVLEQQNIPLGKDDAQPKITLDSGSSHSVIGQETLSEICKEKPHLVFRYIKSPVKLAYRLGGGEVEKTDQRVTLQLGFLPHGHQEVTFSVVGASAARLPPLLGREYLDEAGATLDFKALILRVPDSNGQMSEIRLGNTKQGHLGHSLSAEVDDQGFLMKAAIPRAEPVTARQAKRWAQTKSSNMPRLRRWLALLICACASVGLAHVISGDEVEEAGTSMPGTRKRIEVWHMESSAVHDQAC